MVFIYTIIKFNNTDLAGTGFLKNKKEQKIVNSSESLSEEFTDKIDCPEPDEFNSLRNLIKYCYG